MIKQRVLRVFYVVHKWTGIVAGFALFVAFYAGALTMYHAEIARWQQLPRQGGEAQTVADAQKLLDSVLTRFPEVADATLTIKLPNDRGDPALAYFNTVQGFHHVGLADLDGSGSSLQSNLAEFINELHYALAIPLVGGYLMGAVSLLYGIALVSGAIIYWPRLKREFLALRVARSAKLFWLDAHNLVGIVSLPFHVVFAWTGAVLSLGLVVMMLLNSLVFRNELLQELPLIAGVLPSQEASADYGDMLDIQIWIDRAQQLAEHSGGQGFVAEALRIRYPGRTNAMVEVRGRTSGHVGASGSVALNAVTAEPVNIQIAGSRDGNHAVLSIFYALHFGHFGGAFMQLIYFVLALAGAFLFYSGNILFIENRGGEAEQNKPWLRYLARATVGICLGCCAGISAAFVAAQMLIWTQPSATYSGALLERAACFAVWLLCVIWAGYRRPDQAAREILILSAVSCIVAAMLHLGSSDWGFAWEVDLMLLALAVGFVALARTLSCRRFFGYGRRRFSERIPEKGV